MGEEGAGSSRMASRARGIGRGFADGVCARTEVVARNGRRKIGISVIRIVRSRIELVSYVRGKCCNGPEGLEGVVEEQSIYSQFEDLCGLSFRSSIPLVDGVRWPKSQRSEAPSTTSASQTRLPRNLVCIESCYLHNSQW